MKIRIVIWVQNGCKCIRGVVAWLAGWELWLVATAQRQERAWLEKPHDASAGSRIRSAEVWFLLNSKYYFSTMIKYETW